MEKVWKKTIGRQTDRRCMIKSNGCEIDFQNTAESPIILSKITSFAIKIYHHLYQMSDALTSHFY